MKKTLLSLALVAGFFGYSQDIVFSEDCSTMTLGNIGTDLTGTTAGQNGWYTFVGTTASPAGANSDFQVVDMAGSNGNALQIYATSAAASGQARYLFQDLTNAWTNRTSGNDFAHVEFDLYSGSATTSKTTFRTYIFATDGTAMAGLYFVPETKVIKGWAHYDNAGSAGYYIFQLGASADVTLDPDTWYKIGVAYDYNTGDITWKESTGLFYGGVTGDYAGNDITEFDFLTTVSATSGNTTATNVTVDNVLVKFDALENLLGVKNSEEMKFLRISPNPAKDVLTISNQDTTFNSIEVTDLNGRVVAATKPNAVETTQVNIADLSAGVYMVKIVSDKGTVTKKIIKN